MKRMSILPLLLLMSPAWALEPMAEEEMESVTGQAGIAVELGLDINTNPDGTTALTDCDTLGGPCRLAISFANRTDEWLVLKGYYGNLSIPTLNLDSGFLGDAANDTSLFDDSKFRDDAGNCLLPGGTCDTATLDGMAAMKLSTPAASGSYDASSGTSSGYTNLSMGLTIKGIAMEFGAGATGYNANANGSFMGLKMADNNGNFANVNISGDAYIFGF